MNLTIHLIQLATYNAYVICRHTTTERLMFILDFELAIITSLTAIEAVVSTASVAADVARLQYQHFANHITAPERKSQP